MTEYRKLAATAMAKCVGYDPYFPEKSDVMINAWAEALEDAHITEVEDVLMAVRVMYRMHGDPGWRPTPKILADTAKECRNLRIQREEQPPLELEGPEKVTYREFRERHPEVEFPKFGKAVP